MWNTRTILTIAVVLVWMAGFVVRLNNPLWEPGSAIDALMLVVISWWFATAGVKKPPNGNGNGKKK